MGKMNMTDGELLRRYVRDRSETAFGELVQRHITLVYSAALRQVNGDTHLAEDVTQSVFADLARKAARLIRHTSLTGWLYTSTRFVATNVRRTEQRRSIREREAHAMNAFISSTEPEPDWALIRPLLDEAMHSLDEPDREAVLLRHFEKHSYAEIGARFDLTENAARMRVERALEKLHGTLAKHGVTSTVMAMAGLLAANAVGAAPAHLAAKVAQAALAGAATAGGLSALFAHLLAVSKIKLAAAAVVLATVAVLMVASRHTGTTASGKVVAGVVATNSVAEVFPATTTPTNPAAVVPAVPPLTNGSSLRLEIVAADSGKPLPMVPIEYRSWVSGKFEGKQFTSDRFGVCDVVYPTNLTWLELTTRKDNFTDTRLLWRPPNGDVIPTNYVMRVDRPTPIGGRVLDADGKPVAGAKVGWNHGDDPAALKLPQNHEFSWIEVTTDQDGRWRINRIAEDMIHRIYGSARDTEYVDSVLVFAGQDKTTENQLRDGTHVFRLGRAVTVQGLVVDAGGSPIADAKILVGHIGDSGRREGKSQSDGTFSIPGCPPGKPLVSAEAPGYAATTVEADLAGDAGPIRLTLQPGKTLRLRVVDKAGNPVPKAQLWLDTFGRGGPLDSERPKPVQVEYNSQTDHEGRVVWTNAPDAELTFDVQASGFMRVSDVKIQPDGEEHIITLPSALVVHGAVYDAATGRRIPRFRLVQGWPGRNPVAGTTNVQWSTIGRFWLDFQNGAYTNSFEEGVLGGTKNPGYILKFMADGYAPFVSRVIGADEGDVQLNVNLHRAAATLVTVNKPDGQPAGNADVGLVSPGACLSLGLGGFNRQNVQSGGSLLRTKADGTFELPPDDSITRVMVASPDGYAEAAPTALSANPVLQLQPWGQLQVACFSGGKPAVGREYELELGGGSSDAVAFDFGMSRVKTDEQGRFLVSQLPPGRHQLIRIYLQPKIGNTTSWMNGDKTPFEIQPGVTTTLNLGASNYTVTARLQWPPGIQRQSQWQIAAFLHTPMPVIPPEVMTNETARAAFLQTDEFKAARQNTRSYQATINGDDAVSADEVRAGDYVFGVAVFEVPKGNPSPGAIVKHENLFQGTINVTIPADPPSGSLDVGVIEMQAVPVPP